MIVGIDYQIVIGLKPYLEHVLHSDVVNTRSHDQISQLSGLNLMIKRSFLKLSIHTVVKMQSIHILSSLRGMFETILWCNVLSIQCYNIVGSCV